VGDDNAAALDVQTFDPATGETTVVLEKTFPDGPPWAVIAAEPGGARFACLTGVGEKPAIVLFDAEGEKTIPLDAKIEGAGYLIWHGDAVILSAQMKAEEEGAEAPLGLLAVNVETGESDFVKLGDADKNGAVVLMMQPSISPDGRMLAVMIPATSDKELTSLAILGLGADFDKPAVFTVPPKTAAETERPAE
jgi:hypothetical protein